MSYALVCTGAGHVTIPTKTTTAGALRICRFDIELTSYTTAFLYGSAIDNPSNNNVRINSATQVAIQTTVGTTRTINMPADSIPLNTRLVIEVFRTAAPAFEVWVDGVLKGSAAIGTTERDQLMPVSYIGAATNGTAKIRAKIYEADLFGNTYLNASDPNASTWGDGTLVGFPTNGTQWFEYGGGTTPIAFTGTIPNQTFTNGQSVSVDLSTYFSGTQTPFTFANTGTALTGTGLSISSDGLLTGTATTGSVSGVVVTGTDADTNTAASNSFNVTVNAAGSPPAGTFTIGTITTTETTASVPYTYSTADFDTIEYRIDGGAPVTASASPQALTGLTSATTYGIEFRAVNAFGNGAWSTSAPFATSAVPVGTIIIPDVVNNTNTPWASTAVDAATVMPVGLGSVVVNKTGLSVTAGAELVISDASIVTGTEYIILIKIGTAYGWYRAVAT